jgi:acyl-coenzyme A thioesterase PaaI-like protein
MGIANYFDSDPNFTAQQEAELVRLTSALRRIIDCNVKLNAPLDTLTRLANDAEAMLATMEPYSSVRPIAAHNKVFKPEDVNWSAPYSPVVGRCNPLSPPMQMMLEDNKAVSLATFGDPYEGPPNCVHGGIVALAWDHVMALSNMLLNARGPTAWLHVEYRKPTPLYTPLRFEAWIDRVEGKKIFVKGACYANGEVVTEASGLFINTVIKNIGVEEEMLRQQVLRGEPEHPDDRHPLHPARFTAD